MKTALKFVVSLWLFLISIFIMVLFFWQSSGLVINLWIVDISMAIVTLLILLFFASVLLFLWCVCIIILIGWVVDGG